MAAALVLVTVLAHAPPAQIAAASASVRGGSLWVQVVYANGSPRAIEHTSFSFRATADGRPIWAWELADATALAPGQRRTALWRLDPSVLVPGGFRCPTPSSPVTDCVSVTRVVDLNRAAKKIDVLVSKVAFSDDVWMAPPDSDKYVTHVNVDMSSTGK